MTANKQSYPAVKEGPVHTLCETDARGNVVDNVKAPTPGISVVVPERFCRTHQKAAKSARPSYPLVAVSADSCPHPANPHV